METKTVAAEPLRLSVGQPTELGPDPRVALALAVLVGVLVFFVLWRLRKVFGVKRE